MSLLQPETLNPRRASRLGLRCPISVLLHLLQWRFVGLSDRYLFLLAVAGNGKDQRLPLFMKIQNVEA